MKDVLSPSRHHAHRFSLDPLAARDYTDRSPILRWSAIALMVIVGLLMETTVFSSWRIFGAAPSFGYVAVAAVAYYAGANTALVFGFCAGVGSDIFYRTPLGVSGLSMMACGLVIGMMQTGMMRPTPLAVPLMGLCVSIAGNAVYVLISIIVGFESLFSAHTAYVILISSLINMVASPFIFVIVKKFIGAPAWKNR
ncbi:MAG TPA: rod shape-determining protein MreD [Acidimicrobiia bacterium]|nr:rod shape-determining protein MreD [Acidimicrobiia bacterium]